MGLKKRIFFIVFLIVITLFPNLAYAKDLGNDLITNKINEEEITSKPSAGKPYVVDCVFFFESKGNDIKSIKYRTFLSASQKSDKKTSNTIISALTNKIRKLLIILVVISLLIITICLIAIRKNMIISKRINRNMKKNTIKIRGSFNNSIKLSFANIQNIGMREEQQDSFAISNINDKKLFNEKGVFAIVADGMGGLDNGKESSSIVVESMMSYFNEKLFVSPIPIELRNMIINSNNELLDYLSRGGNIKSGSTSIAVIIKGSQLFWISVGDSRIYLYRRGKVFTLNRDHVYGTELNEKAFRGQISFEEALNHPDRKALTSYMGIQKMTEIDQNIKPFKLNQGDKIILCSDGIYGSLDEKEIEEAMKLDTQNAAIELQNSILKKNIKYQDNLTAVVIGIS